MSDVSIVECQTCTSKALWRWAADGAAWAVHHSRSTGHPDKYRIKPLDVHSIRGRVWWDQKAQRWKWTVKQPGLTVSWGTALNLDDAENRCRSSVAIYRKLPVAWEVEA